MERRRECRRYREERGAKQTATAKSDSGVARDCELDICGFVSRVETLACKRDQERSGLSMRERERHARPQAVEKSKCRAVQRGALQCGVEA